MLFALQRELPALVARRKELFAAADGAWSVAAVFVLPFPDIPADLLGERVAVATNSFLHAAALRAARKRRDQLVDDDVFRRNLVDMFLGATTIAF